MRCSATRRVRFAPDEDTEDLGVLMDFCRMVETQLFNHCRPLRIEGSVPEHQLYELIPVRVYDFPDDHAPVSLLRAVREDLLSARKKIHIAFTLAKSFWQYYDSELMHATWSLDTIYLLPQRGDPTTLNLETQAPFLSMEAIRTPARSVSELQPRRFKDGEPCMHRHPYILNLCLLLVLLCTETGELPANLPTVNGIYLFCQDKIGVQARNWPSIDTNERYRKIYRNIVKECLPQSLCKPIGSSVEERRDMLRDNIVQPLYNVLTGMGGVERDRPLESAPRNTEVTPSFSITAPAGFQADPHDDPGFCDKPVEIR
jgi:hypothetical protein